MVLAGIKPIWATRTETLNRVRDRIKVNLNRAEAHGLRDGGNPAEWRGSLEHALPAPTKVSRSVHQPQVRQVGIREGLQPVQSQTWFSHAPL